MLICKRRIWNGVKSFFRSIDAIENLSNLPPIILWPEVNTKFIKRWKSLDDRSYKGKSCSKFEIDSKNNVLRFFGDVIFDEDIAKITKAKSSFCAIKGVFEKPVDMRDYEGIEITMRSNIKANYILNIECSSSFDDDLYQIDLEPMQSKWCTYQIPFSAFR